jgi:hypothetical protein
MTKKSWVLTPLQTDRQVKRNIKYESKQRQTDRQVKRNIKYESKQRQTDRQTDKQANNETLNTIQIKTDRQTDKKRETLNTNQSIYFVEKEKNIFWSILGLDLLVLALNQF